MTLLDHPLATGIAPAWAAAWGEDAFGVFAVLRVGEAEQKLRYLPPGTFRMGSPLGEAGRFELEEEPHLVSLESGFWLADTPCTQDFWQVVMNSNRSRFQDPHRPVEQVSWGDIQEFLARLEERLPGCGVGLPTEAQWEYACRAGTTTSTYAGELEILGANHAPLLDKIAWYGGNSGWKFDRDDGLDSSDWPEKQYAHVRAGTRRVGTKLPNAWGLYDMLGNVWEWTATAAPGADSALGSYRVVRGGSWLESAGYVRAAYRLWNEPGIRYEDLGFRFSLVRAQDRRGARSFGAERRPGRERSDRRAERVSPRSGSGFR